MSAMPVEDLARLALDGDRDAVERLVGQLQGDIYGLALRMLWNREDAEDATQEILVRAVTRLAQFDFRSKLKTWVYRIAVNYILDVKKSAAERMHLTFAQFADDLAEGLSSAGPADTERSLLTEEVKIGCTLGMSVGNKLRQRGAIGARGNAVAHSSTSLSTTIVGAAHPFFELSDIPVSDRGTLEGLTQFRFVPPRVCRQAIGTTRLLRSNMREGRFCATLFRTARNLLILNGEMSEWSIEHAWKLIPSARADAHENLPTHF